MYRPLLSLALAAVLVGCGDADAPIVDETTTVAVTPSTDASTSEAVAVEADPEAPPVAEAAAPREAAPSASTPAAAPAPRSGAPTTAQCRSDIGPRVAQEPMRLVADQTFAATSPGLGAGCFVTSYDPVSMADGSVYPYSYTFTDASGGRERTLTTMPSAEPAASSRLVAVGFGDLNADGRSDVVMVHDDCALALSWLLDEEDWFHSMIDDGVSGLAACTVAEAKAAYKAYWAEPTSP